MTIYLPALCGTCDHHHTAAGCNEDGCECPGWLPHPSTDAADTDRELYELADFGGHLPLVDSSSSGAIAQVLIRFEEDSQKLDRGTSPVNGTLPCLAVVSFDKSLPLPGNAAETVFHLNVIRLPESFWACDDSDSLISVAERWVAEQHEEPDTGPTVAWAIATYCVADLDGPDKPGRKAHVVAATDIDGRMYTVVHTLDDDRGHWSIRVAPGWAKLMRGELDLASPEARAAVGADNLSQVHRATAHLMAVTRYETARLVAVAHKEKP
jgi:hypothetical protein